MVRNRAFGRILEERKKTTFFKIFVSADLLSESMRLIPYNFKGSECKDEPPKVTLKVVWGRTWTVKLSEFMGLYLMEKKGWEKFLNDNRLGDDEFLTFTDVGDNCLAVNIFEKNGIEILKPRDTTTIIASSFSKDVKKEEMDSTVGECSRRGAKRKERAEEAEELKKMKRADSDVKNDQMSNVGPVIVEPTRRGRKGKKKRSMEEDRRKRFKMTTKKKKADKNGNIASSSSSRKVPSFTKIIKPSSLFVLTIPTRFAKKHMPKERATFTIRDPRGKTHEVIYDCREGRQKLFSCGWRIVVRVNGIVVGDRCTLRLIQPGEMVLEVVAHTP